MNASQSINPSQPTASDMQHIQELFFRQMRRTTRMTTDPVMRARQEREAAKPRQQRVAEHLFLNSFDFQFSDRWTYI